MDSIHAVFWEIALKIESNRHSSKVHFYTYVERAWDMFRQGLVPMDVASNQSICGDWKALVTQNESKVTCANCIKIMERTNESEQAEKKVA